MQIALRHLGGAQKTVEITHIDRAHGVAQVWWPVAGIYELDLAKGTLTTISGKGTQWQAEERELEQLRQCR
jgi:hypothetical protein